MGNWEEVVLPVIFGAKNRVIRINFFVKRETIGTSSFCSLIIEETLFTGVRVEKRL